MITYARVKQQLEASSFRTFVTVVSSVLAQKGFGDVVSMGRHTRSGKSRHGGFDLRCRYGTGDFQQVAVVKLIHDDSIRLRMLCELAGTVVLQKANLGILVSTRRTSDRMRAIVPLFGALKVEVIDGEQLALMMARLGVGMRGHCEIDYEYFETLEQKREAFDEFEKSLKL